MNSRSHLVGRSCRSALIFLLVGARSMECRHQQSSLVSLRRKLGRRGNAALPFGWCPEAPRCNVTGSLTRSQRGYLLVEALVYIGLVFVVLGVGYAAMYKCIDNSMVLRRNADDILSAVHSGEVWRRDVRSARGPIRWDADTESLYFTGARAQMGYRFATNTVLRRIGSGPWVPLLPNVKSSVMRPDPRQTVSTWRWELELQPESKGRTHASRIRPVFSFIAVPPSQPQSLAVSENFSP